MAHTTQSKAVKPTKQRKHTKLIQTIYENKKHVNQLNQSNIKPKTKPNQLNITKPNQYQDQTNTQAIENWDPWQVICMESSSDWEVAPRS